MRNVLFSILFFSFLIILPGCGNSPVEDGYCRILSNMSDTADKLLIKAKNETNPYMIEQIGFEYDRWAGVYAGSLKSDYGESVKMRELAKSQKKALEAYIVKEDALSNYLTERWAKLAKEHSDKAWAYDKAARLVRQSRTKFTFSL